MKDVFYSVSNYVGNVFGEIVRFFEVRRNEMKEIVMIVSGFLGGVISYFFGAWDKYLDALIIFMGIDYVTGLIVAMCFHKSPKSTSGRLLSSAMFRGLCKKGMMLLFVIIGYRLDALVGDHYIKAAVIFAFIINELLSIIENAGIMGVPIPEVLRRALDVLHNKAENGGK